MVSDKEHWSCVFVDRIIDKRIVLTSPQKFGKMSSSNNYYQNKYRHTFPKKIGPICGNSNENKLIKAIAFAIAFNKNDLIGSSGLILRGHKAYLSIIAPYSEYVKPHPKENIISGTTNWLIYISPKLELFTITVDRRIGPRLNSNIEKSVNECIYEIQKY